MINTKDIQIRDPFVLRNDKDGLFYLYGSTDKDIWKGPGTGFDVYVGKNLKDWDGPFPAFRPTADFWGKENFWAPEVHEYDGSYYMFASFKAPDRCRATHILKSNSPLGPFNPISKDPVTPHDWECLDGTLYVDKDQNPWIVFCHEWVQVRDGQICARRLSRDLTQAQGDPVLLFTGSTAPWTQAHRRRDGSIDPEARVTDGPFMYTMNNGTLLMLWSSFSGSGYAMGSAYSETGSILGPWKQNPQPIIDTDGGHGMAFKDFKGNTYITYHSPNKTPDERFFYVPVQESSHTLIRQDQNTSGSEA